ncbi:MAG: glycosyltransferase involved in cell wall biosynthesis [Candidatus Omnitrophota bacterium]|jgi:glycosyltransferase involved in cell wall biosynthesis
MPFNPTPRMESLNVNDRPLVSFLIAAYNEERYVVECVDSCLNQTYQPVEVCVTDDGSTDRTWEVLQTAYAQDPRVKLARLEENKGKVYAFNRSYELAEGKYLTVIGADDVNEPTRVEKCMAPLLNDPGIAITFCDLKLVDASLGLLHASFYRMLGHVKKFEQPDFDYASYLATRSLVSGNAITIGPVALESIFPIPETLRFEDWWITFVATFYGSFHYVDEALVLYRQHGANDNGSRHSLWKDYTSRVKLIGRNPPVFAAFLDFLEARKAHQFTHAMLLEKHIHELVQLQTLAERKAHTRAFLAGPGAEGLLPGERTRLNKFTHFGRRVIFLSVLRKHLSQPFTRGPDR